MSGKLIRVDEQRLTQSEAMEEYMFLGLRLADGVGLRAFEREFGQSLNSVYGAAVEELAKLGLLLQADKSVKLTQRGMLLSNQVFIRFIQTTVKS